MKTPIFKFIIAIFVLFIIATLGSLIVEWNIRRNMPMQLQAAMSNAKSTQYIRNEIGDLISEKYSFKNYESNDSVNYSFSLIGDKATIQIRSNEISVDGRWKIYRSDTTLIKN